MLHIYNKYKIHFNYYLIFKNHNKDFVLLFINFNVML